MFIFFHITLNVFAEENEKNKDTVYFDGEIQSILIDSDVTIESISFLEASLNSRISNYSNGWDLVGSQYVKADSKVFSSSGGNYKVEINQPLYGPVFYQLKEQDSYFDDNVGSQYALSGAKYYILTYKNISSFCDGDNKMAEFYMHKLTHKSSKFFMAVYD